MAGRRRSALTTDILRTIWRSKARWIAIMLMTMLSASVFVGLIGTGFNMRALLEEPLEDTNAEHVRVSSALRLQAKDQEILESFPGVEAIEYGRQATFFFENDDIITVLSSPQKMSTLLLTEGTLAKNADEIVLDDEARKDGIKLGDTVSIRPEATNDEDEDPVVEPAKLTSESFKVVGFANSTRFMGNMGNDSRGRTTLGDGSIDYFGYVPHESFVDDDPDIAYLRFTSLTGLATPSSEFRDKSQTIVDELETALEQRPGEMRDKIVDDAMVEISDGRKEVKDGWDELQKAETDLADAKKKLEDGWKEYDDGVATFEKETADARRKLEDSEKKLSDAKSDLDKGERDYRDGQNKYEDGKRQQQEGEKKLDEAAEELEEGRRKIREAEELLKGITHEYIKEQRKELDEAQEQVDGAWRQIDAALKEQGTDRQKVLDSEDELRAAKPQLEEGLAQAKAGRDQAQEALDELNRQMPDWEERVAQLEQAAEQMRAQLVELKEMRDDAQEQVSALETSITELREQLDALPVDDPGRPALEARLAELEAALEQARQGVAELDAQIAALEAQLAEVEKTIEQLTLPARMLREAEEAVARLEAQLAQVNATLELIDQMHTLMATQTQIDEARKKLAEAEKGLLALEEAHRQLRAGEIEYGAGLKRLEDAARQLRKAAKELADARVKLDDGLAKYEDGVRKLADGKRTFDAETRKAQSKLDDAHKELVDGQAEYEDGLKEYRDELPKATKDLNEATADLDEAEAKLADVRVPTHVVTSRYGDYSINTLQSGASSLDGMTSIFVSAFYLIAVLITFTTTTRMVDEERTEIGTLKALGYSPNVIARKYLAYGTTASLLGGVLGVVVGHFIITRMIVLAYMDGTFVVENPSWSIQWWAPVAAIALSAAVTLFAAWISVRKTLRENAAALLRPKTAAAGNRVFLERIKPLWSRLGFTTKVTLRNATAKKSRMFMTVIGVLGGTALMILGFGIRESVSAILEKQTERIDHYDMQVVFDPDAKSEELTKVRGAVAEKAELSTEVFFDEGTFKDTTGLAQSFNVVVPFNVDEFSKLRPFQDRTTQAPISLSDAGAVATERLGTMANVTDGEQLTVMDRYGAKATVTLGDLSENYVGHYLFLTAPTYEQAFKEEAEANSIWVKTVPGTDIDALADQLKQSDAVLMVTKSSDTETSLSSLMDSLNAVVFVIIAISALLAFVVLFNLTNLNVAERLRELSTIKVLGFRSLEVTQYIYRETWLLSGIGILLGFGAGRALHLGVTTAMSPPAVLIDPALDWPSYLGGGLLTVAFTLIVMLLIHRNLKRVDMVEALKAIE